MQHSQANYLGVLTTPEALFLVLIGVCMSVLSYYKGLHAFDDPYPGYGERHRAALAARDDLLAVFDETAGEIEARFEEGLSDSVKAWKARTREIGKHTRLVQACIEARRELERAVGEAESTLKGQVAEVAGHHRAARGAHTPLGEAALDQLASFQEFLAGCELPAYLHPPDLQDQKRQLARAKSEALRRLSALFEEVLGTLSGQTPGEDP